MLDCRPRPQGQACPEGNRVWRRNLLPADLADGLRRARQARGLSLRQAAREAGISAPFLSRLERAERCPRTAVAARLVRALQLHDDLADELLAAAVDSCPAPSGTVGGLRRACPN